MKRLIVMMMAIAMVLSFAGCGGGGNEAPDAGTDQQEAPAAAETTDGIKDIVFSVPEGWTKESAFVGSSISFVNTDDTTAWGVECTDESNLGGYTDTEETKTVEDYYKELTKPSEDKEVESSTVMGLDAKVVKVKKDDGFVDVATYFMKDGTLYDIYMARMGRFDKEGKIKKDAKVLTDEEMAVHDAIISSVEEGDGAELQMQGLNANELGDVTFDTPKGFDVEGVSDEYITFKNGRKAYISINQANKDNIKEFVDIDANGEQVFYDNVKEYFEAQKKKSQEEIEIAGNEGYKKDISESKRSGAAGFITDDVAYTIDMWMNFDAEAEDGFTKEEVEAMNGFIESIKMK